MIEMKCAAENAAVMNELCCRCCGAFTRQVLLEWRDILAGDKILRVVPSTHWTSPALAPSFVLNKTRIMRRYLPHPRETLDEEEDWNRKKRRKKSCVFSFERYVPKISSNGVLWAWATVISGKRLYGISKRGSNRGFVRWRCLPRNECTSLSHSN